jgi:hypothetical protein
VRVRDPADRSVPVKVVESESLVSRDLAARRDGSAVGQNVLDVDRVGEDDGRRLAVGHVDGLAAAIVVGEEVAGNAAARERPVCVGAHLIAVAGCLIKTNQ